MPDRALRAVFIGCVQSSAVALDALLRNPRVLISGVVTLSTAPSNSDHIDLQARARSEGADVLLSSQSSAIQEFVRQQACDVVFCIGWSRLLTRGLLSVPPRGVIGYHPAALPANRGRHPIIWALALGLSETASTLFLMDERADAGPILSQVPVVIRRHDDARSLYDRVLGILPTQLDEVVDNYLIGGGGGFVQDESRANVWRKRGKQDGRIDWRMTGVAIHNLVRALARPYPGAHFESPRGDVKVWKVQPVEMGRTNDEPGKVLSVDGRHITVRCADGAVTLIEHDMQDIPETSDYL